MDKEIILIVSSYREKADELADYFSRLQIMTEKIYEYSVKKIIEELDKDENIRLIIIHTFDLEAGNNFARRLKKENKELNIIVWFGELTELTKENK